MKILELRFKNLNSLYGEWVIDFTDDNFTADGIFALTGPTGAGKSTILDALCLALYGETPRLGKITKSTNEIMSRGTGECYAEVTFASQAGLYRCHWSQHRARRKADGRLAESKHEISEAENGRILESKKRNVAAVIEEKTGMDFERFTRSILLAQGGFDTFLKADTELKSRLLEQITGTGIYTRISLKVHERKSQEAERLNVLRAESSGISFLSDELEEELKKSLQVSVAKKEILATRMKQTHTFIEWLLLLKKLEAELTGINAELAAHEERTEQFKPERTRLDSALKAANLEGEFSILSSLGEQQNVDSKKLRSEQQRLPELEKRLQQSQDKLKEIKTSVGDAKKRQQELLVILKRVRLLDYEVSELNKRMAAMDEDRRRENLQLGTLQTLLAQKMSAKESAEAKLQQISAYLQNHSGDQLLVSELTGIESQVQHVNSLQDIIGQGEQTEKHLKLQLDEHQKLLEKSIKELGVERNKLQELQESKNTYRKSLSVLLGDRLLREYKTEKDSLIREQIFLRKIADLESERAKLVDGHPCPLCGSDNHPFARGNEPQKDELEVRLETLTRLIDKAETLDEQLRLNGERETHLLSTINRVEKKHIALEGEKKRVEKDLVECGKQLHEQKEALQNSLERLNKAVQPFEMTVSTASVDTLIEELKKRQHMWLNIQQKRADVDKELLTLIAEIKGTETHISTNQSQLSRLELEREELKKKTAAVRKNREDIFSDKNPDTEEQSGAKAIEEVEKKEQRAFLESEQIRKSLQAVQLSVNSLIEITRERSVSIKSKEDSFSRQITEAGFNSQQQFLSCRLSPQQRERLIEKARFLDDHRTALMARRDDCRKKLERERDKKLTGKALAELESAKLEDENALRQLSDEVATTRHRLLENDAAKKKVEEKVAQIKAQERECSRWDKLHHLIGSADGKKYRNFAQGLTFELMVSHANKQLARMTDRYLLTRNRQHPLELDVVDSYQAGEIRSTRNLSGGESFIVSLALSLGLSKMASNRVRVDSLFLDEGFGTLDEDALEIALDTLASLKEDGKLIGVISHVSALKDRITTQISIIPGTGGKSVVSGPGCSLI